MIKSTSGNHSSATHKSKKQPFTYEDAAAKSVRLVGDFTHWEEQPIPLRKGRDGVWKASVELKPGAHYYRFLVDGQWRDDPKATVRAPNPFGTEDSVLEIS